METLPVEGTLPDTSSNIECWSNENAMEKDADLLSTDSNTRGLPKPETTLHIIDELDDHDEDSQALPLNFNLAE
jgi:hypothetical protein